MKITFEVGLFQRPTYMTTMPQRRSNTALCVASRGKKTVVHAVVIV